MITYGVVNSTDDLKGILKLQKANLSHALSENELNDEGFVTIDHSLSLLIQLNDPYPHIIAKENGTVIGYALVMLPKWRNKIEVLVPMFDEINKLKMNDKALDHYRYFVMGQVCVAKEYRKQGVFRKLYEKMASRMKRGFDLIITEVSDKNQRSLMAHLNVGFQSIKEYTSAKGDHWHLIAMEI